MQKAGPELGSILERVLIEASRRGDGIHPSHTPELPILSRDPLLGDQTFAERVRLNKAAVLGSEGALALLAELRIHGVLTIDVISQYPNAIVNTGLLCQALLGEIDDRALRITPEGVNYLENLLNFS